MINRIILFLACAAAPFLIKLIYRTLKISVHLEGSLEKSVIGVFHQQLFVYPPFFYYYICSRKNPGRFVTLVSDHRDGEILAEIIKKGFKSDVVRGDSRRKPVAGLKSVLHIMREGRTPLFAVDGPLGPLKKISPGIIYAALAGKRPIRMLLNRAEKKIIFRKAWDKFFIPCPFSRILVYVSENFYPDPKLEISANLIKFEEFVKNCEKDARKIFNSHL